MPQCNKNICDFASPVSIFIYFQSKYKRNLEQNESVTCAACELCVASEAADYSYEFIQLPDLVCGSEKQSTADGAVMPHH